MFVPRVSGPVGEGLNWRRAVCHAYQVTVTTGSHYKHVVGGGVGYLARAPPLRGSCPIEETAVSYDCEVPSPNLSETTLEECTHTESPNHFPTLGLSHIKRSSQCYFLFFTSSVFSRAVFAQNGLRRKSRHKYPQGDLTRTFQGEVL